MTLQRFHDAVRAALAEDQEDLAAFAERVSEPAMTYEALLDDLKAHGNAHSKTPTLLPHQMLANSNAVR